MVLALGIAAHGVSEYNGTHAEQQFHYSWVPDGQRGSEVLTGSRSRLRAHLQNLAKQPTQGPAPQEHC